jgi:hypothetical protein
VANPLPDDQNVGSQVQQWVSFGATIVAPVTLIGALLFYFGYVSSRSQYAYFGIDVDTIGLSTQGYVMRSPQSLLVPLLVLALAGTAFLVVSAIIRRRIALAVAPVTDGSSATTTDAEAALHVERIRTSVHRTALCGLAVLMAGVVLLLGYAYVRGWPFYALLTPLLIAIGATLIAYAWRLATFLQRLQESRPSATAATGVRRASIGPADGGLLARRTATVLIYVVIVVSLFWATATVAQWSGRGLALYQARHLGNLPSVVLDTKERLFLRDPGIQETRLPASPGQMFLYRYRGLRLLIEGQDRMFLVPDHWSASDSTLIVPLDNTVRVQFQFENQPP